MSPRVDFHMMSRDLADLFSCFPTKYLVIHFTQHLISVTRFFTCVFGHMIKSILPINRSRCFFVSSTFSAKTCKVVLSKVVAEALPNAAVPRTPETDAFVWNATLLKLGYVLPKPVRLFSNS